MADPRDSGIYKLILKQKNELEKQVCSDRQLFKDLLVFNHSANRKAELIQDQIVSASDLLKKQEREILKSDPAGLL